MAWCEKTRTKYEAKWVGGSGGPTAGPDSSGKYGRIIFVPVTETYWAWCPDNIDTGVIVGTNPRNGFGEKPGSNGPDRNNTDILCEDQVKSVRFWEPEPPKKPCTEAQKNKIRDAIRAICKDNWKLIQRLNGLKGCSDAIDAMIQCMTSNPWGRAFFDCGVDPEYANADKDHAVATTNPNYNRITINFDQIKKEWRQSTDAADLDFLKKTIFHELIHACGNHLDQGRLTFSTEGEKGFMDELDVWILNYFAYGVENSTYMHEYSQNKFKIVKAYTPDKAYLIKMFNNQGYLKTDAEIYASNEGGSGVYTSLLNQFKDGKDANGVEHQYIWGGSFILDVKTGELFCWDFNEGLARRMYGGGGVPLKLPFR